MKTTKEIAETLLKQYGDTITKSLQKLIDDAHLNSGRSLWDKKVATYPALDNPAEVFKDILKK